MSTTETITWRDPVHNDMPKPMQLVLIEREAAGLAEPVYTGFWDGGFWWDPDGFILPGKVTGWAHMPTGRAGGARHG